ncbi:receptor-like serine/threonine-protein kinase ALE2 isoform X2 [Aristolochia californica]|uniref:receptor-like serine/threonine-protein kinase ALE2 isoform X2 n=1 Tax=Aristolochia californica TaxID=171875 RepID=UPI0035E16259
MRMLMLMLLCSLNLVSSAYGFEQLQINLSPLLPHKPLAERESLFNLEAIAHVLSPQFVIAMGREANDFSFVLPRSSIQDPVDTHPTSHSWGPSSAPAFAPDNQGYAPRPSRASSKHHRHHHHHRRMVPHEFGPAPSPSHGQGCDQISCTDPLTATPIGSPCGCVLPMQVELNLGVAPLAVFPLIQELEIEVAAGTYLKQSQVRIMGANVDSEDQGKTVVDIDLVPLGEKFDNTTALLTYDRFWKKKVPINESLFGDYEVVSIRYPGLPSTPSGRFPAASPDGGSDPITANVIRKSQKMNARTVALIALSSFILVLMCVGAVLILSKCKKLGRASNVVGPAIPSSIGKRSGRRSILSSSDADSSTSLSLVSTVATCILSVKTFSLAELEKATDKFSSRKILGEGGFGRVYLGIMEDGSEVAVKLLLREHQNGDREFIAEIEMLSRLHHRNLVKLIGICIEEHARCLVYELVRNGSVESHLHGADSRKGPLDWGARMKIALGAARGLAYLHEDSNPRVIHRDFKASNILLEEDFTPKVSDFGLAREASEGSQHISTRVMGTFGYVAPEYAMTGHLLVKSDVYSYGVVLLELLSGRKPVDMSQPQGQENLVTWARPLLTSREGLEQLVDPFLAGNYNFDNMARVAAIASMCVHPEVSQRPFMGEVVQALKLVYNDADETCRDSCSQKDGSSGPDCDFKGDHGPDSRWWCGTPRLTYGYASSFITMECSSGPLEEIDRPLSTPTSMPGPGSLTAHNRSGPLRTLRSNPAFYRLRGSMSEHGFFSRRLGADRYWV